MSSSSSLSRNKMSTLSGPKRSSASSVLAGNGISKTSKLRTELRRVMSDRVLKITQKSKIQNVEKVKLMKDNLSNSPMNQNRIFSASQSQIANDHANKFKGVVTAAASQQQQDSSTNNAERMKSPDAAVNIKLIKSPKTSPKFLAKLTGIRTTNISPNAKLSNKISLQPIKTFDLKDKKSLIDHILTSYNDVINSHGSVILTVQSIINSITHYIEANQLDLKISVDEILKENLFQSTIELKKKYVDDEFSEKLKLESQLQVLLQIENYIVANQNSNSGKVKVDDDWVWDIANSIRWLKQKFKDFKIERFLFGDIYANYFLNASDFISSLMEELGYGNESSGNESSSSEDESPSKALSKTARDASQQLLNDSNDKLKNITSSSAKFLSQLSQSQAANPQLSSILKEESNSSFSVIGGVNSLFEEEDTRGTNEFNDLSENDETSNHPTNEKVDVLDEFIKKKPKVGFKDFSQTSVRSIVIHKKRTKLKIRSPFKSPSKGFQNKHQNRRSPRIKDKQIIPNDTGGQKRPRTYLITDTPDHKQNATIITTRQEKLRKRFSFQQFANCASSPSILPSVPDTPVKGDTKEIIGGGGGGGSAALFPFQKIYPSPSKAILFMSPQKQSYLSPQKVFHASPLKVYATPSPKKRPSHFASSGQIIASPQRGFTTPNKSPAKRVIFR